MATRSAKTATRNNARNTARGGQAAKEHPAIAAIRSSETGKVKVAVSDIDGILRGKIGRAHV